MRVLKPGKADFEKEEIDAFPVLPNKKFPVGTLIQSDEKWYENVFNGVEEQWVEALDK